MVFLSGATAMCAKKEEYLLRFYFPSLIYGNSKI